MKIHLLRHAIAASLGESNQFTDSKRALTPEGITKMREASLGLRKLDVLFDLIASSPLVRARETAEIVAEVLKSKGAVQFWDELSPGSSINGVMKRLQEHPDKNSLLLVGHQPDLGALACSLILGSSRTSLAIKKGGICCIEVDEVPPQLPGELSWMLPPKILRMLGAK